MLSFAQAAKRGAAGVSRSGASRGELFLRVCGSGELVRER